MGYMYDHHSCVCARCITGAATEGTCVCARRRDGSLPPVMVASAMILDAGEVQGYLRKHPQLTGCPLLAVAASKVNDSGLTGR